MRRDQEKAREEDKGRATKGPLCLTEEVGLCALSTGESFTGWLLKIQVLFWKEVLMADGKIELQDH